MTKDLQPPALIKNALFSKKNIITAVCVCALALYSRPISAQAAREGYVMYTCMHMHTKQASAFIDSV